MSWDRSLIGRAGYYIRMVVNPQNPDDVFISSSSFHRSQDGGKTFSGNGGDRSHSRRARRAAATATTSGSIRRIRSATSLTDDGGANINTQAGHDPRVAAERADVSRARRQPRAVLDLQQPAGRRDDARAVDELGADGQRLSAGGQHHADGAVGFGRGRGGGGEARRPDAARSRAGRRARDQTRLRAAAAPRPEQRGAPRGSRTSAAASRASRFRIRPTPTSSTRRCYGNKVTRWDARTGTARSIEPWMVSLDSPPNETKYRCHWTAPMAIDPFDHNNVLYGCQLILKTTNGGQSWTEISPDLSTKDPSRIVSNGGIVGDNLGPVRRRSRLGHRVLEDPARA